MRSGARLNTFHWYLRVFKLSVVTSVDTFKCSLVVLLITGVGRPPLVGGNAGNDTDPSYFCAGPFPLALPCLAQPSLAHPTAGNPALPHSRNSIFNLPFPQLFGWRLHHLELAAGLNDHKARGFGPRAGLGGRWREQGAAKCACPDPVSCCNWGWVSYGRLSATGPGQPEAPAHPHQLEPASSVPKEAFRRISMEAAIHSAMPEAVHPYGSTIFLWTIS